MRAFQFFVFLGLESQLNSNGPNGWPKACPQGYTQHLAVVDDTCEINYCVKANSLSALGGLTPVRLPPFRSKPKRNMNITVPLIIINDDTQTVWFKIDQKWTKANARYTVENQQRWNLSKGRARLARAAIVFYKQSFHTIGQKKNEAIQLAKCDLTVDFFKSALLSYDVKFFSDRAKRIEKGGDQPPFDVDMA